MYEAAGNDERVPADEPVIELTRLLDAPRALVWEVLTDPKHLPNWWGPDAFTITTHSHDCRVGGEWIYVMHGPERDFENRITYSEVVRPERLVYRHGDWSNPDLFHVTLTLADEAGKTRLTMRSRFPTVEARDQVIREFGALEGGRQHLGNLAAYLRELQARA
jgi:uncharacterized protein YndB with AHSA1/START domain